MSTKLCFSFAFVVGFAVALFSEPIYRLAVAFPVAREAQAQEARPQEIQPVDLTEAAPRVPIEEHEPAPLLENVQPIAAAPLVLKEMLSVEISGPTDGLRGDLAHFQAAVAGEPEFVSWEISPKVGGFRVLNDKQHGGLAADFANREPGVYVIDCIVSGPAGHARGQWTYEIVADPAPPAPTPPAAPVAAPAVQPVAPAMGPPPGALSFPAAIATLAGQVASNTRGAEALIVAGSFRSVANRIKTGTFAAADPWPEAQQQAREALGAGYGPWARFFSDLANLIGGLRQQGQAATAAASIPFLESAADALGHVR